MITLIAKISWPDGQTATATVHAPTPQGEYSIQYQGLTERLSQPLLTRAQAGHIRSQMQVDARNTEGIYSEVFTGTYDAWAV
jgi:hypothetical protein